MPNLSKILKQLDLEGQELKMSCYFAHPYVTLGTEDEARILKILKSRRIRVINPFDGEAPMLKEYGIDNTKDYYKSPYYSLAKRIWTKDLKQIKNANMILVWMPVSSTGTAAELQYALDLQEKRKKQGIPFLIQIITSVRHPIVAYAMARGNQHFESIDDFERLNRCKWDDKRRI